MQSMAHAELDGNRCGISLEKAWQPTPVFLPGECHGQKSLASYSPWDHKESDMTERLTLSLFPIFPSKYYQTFL